jgi:hypothetical protein
MTCRTARGRRSLTPREGPPHRRLAPSCRAHAARRGETDIRAAVRRRRPSRCGLSVECRPSIRPPSGTDQPRCSASGGLPQLDVGRKRKFQLDRAAVARARARRRADPRPEEPPDAPLRPRAAGGARPLRTSRVGVARGADRGPRLDRRARCALRVKPAAGVLVDLEAWALLDATQGLHRREHCAATAPRRDRAPLRWRRRSRRAAPARPEYRVRRADSSLAWILSRAQAARGRRHGVPARRRDRRHRTARGGCAAAAAGGPSPRAGPRSRRLGRGSSRLRMRRAGAWKAISTTARSSSWSSPH